MEETLNPNLPQHQELPPPPKKPKMSSTTSSGDETTLIDGATLKTPRYKRRKIAIFFAYCGVGYQGMQKNPGAKTIEGDFEEALYQAGAVPESDRGQPKRFDWARSARTDKGVSAVGQVVSGRFYVDPPGFVERLNANLASQIRVFGFKRVTGSFNAKKLCDRRRYVYLIPVFALDPSCHRDRESVLASLGSGNDLVKCEECSERGRKVVGLMGNKRDLVGEVDNEGLVKAGISSNTEYALLSSVNKGGDELKSGALLLNDVNSPGFVSCGNENEEGSSLLSNEVKKEESGALLSNDVNSRGYVSCGNENENGGPLLSNEVNEEKGDCNVSLNSNGMVESNAVVEPVISEDGSGPNSNGGTNGVEGGKQEKKEKNEFKYGDEVKERFNKILKFYEGTHNFHNFTTRTKAEDPSAKRYIVSFQANTTVTLEGIEFVKCEVVGQSFMLHQIRKMMGMAVSIMRNFVPESIFEKAFQQEVRINVPTAPEVGLYLDECFFTSYNNKWKNSHEEVSMKDYVEEAEEFKLKHIYSHIANAEHKYGGVGLWLHSLNYRNYPDFHPVDGNAQANIDSKITETETPVMVDTSPVPAWV